MFKTTSVRLRYWLASGVLDADQYCRAMASGEHEPTQADWQKFFRLFTMGLSIGALVVALLFYVAYNWAVMPRWMKFALVEAGLVLSVLGYAYQVRRQATDGPLAPYLLLNTALIIGILLALYGQVYQTGADNWRLFANWLLLITPLMMVSRFMPMWVMWWGLLNLTVTLIYQQWPVVLLSLGEVAYLLLMLGLNTLGLLVVECLMGRFMVFVPAHLQCRNPLVSRLLLGVCLCLLAGLMFECLPKNLFSSAATAPLLWHLVAGFWLSLAIVIYRYIRLDLVCLGGCLVGVGLYVIFLAQCYLYTDLSREWRSIFHGFSLIIIVFISIQWLRSLARSRVGKRIGKSQQSSDLSAEHAVDHDLDLWKQLQRQQVVDAEAALPTATVSFAWDLTAIFGLLILIAAIAFSSAVFEFFPHLYQETEWLMSLFVCCLATAFYWQRRQQWRSVNQMLVIVLLLMGQMFLLVALFNLKQSLAFLVGGYLLLLLPQLLIFYQQSVRFLLLLITGGVGIYWSHLQTVDGIVMGLLCVVWCYVVQHEDSLVARYSWRTIIPFSHGLLVLVLLAAVTTDHQLALTIDRLTEWQFAITSLLCLGALLTTIYWIIGADQNPLHLSVWLIGGGVLVSIGYCVPIILISVLVILTSVKRQRYLWLVSGGGFTVYVIWLLYMDTSSGFLEKMWFLSYFALMMLVSRFLVPLIVERLDHRT